MTKSEDKHEQHKSGSVCASEREGAVAWNGSRERMTRLTEQYDKAKETERRPKEEPTR